MKEYKEVPSIISTKDLDYLQDMFNWLFGAYKNIVDAEVNITDEKLQKVLDKTSNELYKFMEQILEIINGGLNENK